jgi:hypothetical protein
VVFCNQHCCLRSTGDTVHTWKPVLGGELYENCGFFVYYHMRAAGEQSLQHLAGVIPASHFCFCRRDPRNVDGEHSLEKWTLTTERPEAPIKQPSSKSGLQLDYQTLHTLSRGRLESVRANNMSRTVFPVGSIMPAVTRRHAPHWRLYHERFPMKTESRTRAKS